MTITFGVPQFVMTSFLLGGSIIALARFGELKKPDKYDVVDVFLGPAIVFLLLSWGGFYG